MKYQLAEKSHYLLKHAMYELTYEKLKDDPNWSINRSPTLSCTKSRLPIRFLSAGLQA